MWNQIVQDLKRLRTGHGRAAEVAKLQVEMESKMGASEFSKFSDQCVEPNEYGDNFVSSPVVDWFLPRTESLLVFVDADTMPLV